MLDIMIVKVVIQAFSKDDSTGTSPHLELCSINSSVINLKIPQSKNINILKNQNINQGHEIM